jgi:hypothetical protein
MSSLVLSRAPFSTRSRFPQNRIYDSSRVPKRIFSYEQAVALLPEVQRITSEAVERVETAVSTESEVYEDIVTEWAEAIMTLGIEVKGLWLIDFDSGGGYYCWKHPEPALEYFHGYDEGFGGRVKLN